MQQMWAALGALGAISLAVSWSAFRLMRSRRAVTLNPEEAVRIRGEAQIYRSRFLESGPKGWVFAAPLSRDSHVPFRLGEQLAFEAMRPTGVIAFRSTIVERDPEGRTFTIQEPEDTYVIDRRQFARHKTDLMIEIDGIDARMLDLSEGGLRFRCWRHFKVAERVMIKFPWLDIPIGAWILAVQEKPGHPPCCEYRATLEERVDPDDIASVRIEPS